eukprot:3884447-Heterocapsa_arctica.AAC.1
MMSNANNCVAILSLDITQADNGASPGFQPLKILNWGILNRETYRRSIICIFISINAPTIMLNVSASLRGTSEQQRAVQ